MNTTTSWLGRASVALAATALATGILLAGMAHEGKECKRLTNVCASNAAGKALCRSERCPGECQCCRATDSNVSGAGFRITVGGRVVYCNTWSGPCSHQPTWCNGPSPRQ